MKTKIVILCLIALLTSCGYSVDPLKGPNDSVNVGMIAPVNNNELLKSDFGNLFGTSDELKGDTTRKVPLDTNKNNKVAPKKRALPLPCLNLTKEQLSMLDTLRKQVELKNLQARKEYETKLKNLRDSLTKNSVSKNTNDSLLKIINELTSQLQKNEVLIKSLNTSYSKGLDSISVSYKEKMKLAGNDRVAIQNLEKQMNLDKKAYTENYNNKLKELQNKQKELQNKIFELKSKLSKVENPDTKKTLLTLASELEKQLKQTIENNEKEFLVLFRTILTPEQQAIYDEWLKGKDCNSTTNPVK